MTDGYIQPIKGKVIRYTGPSEGSVIDHADLLICQGLLETSSNPFSGRWLYLKNREILEGTAPLDRFEEVVDVDLLSETSV